MGVIGQQYISGARLKKNNDRTLNYFANVNPNDYMEIYWATDKANIFQLLAETTPAVGPEVPSIILTVNQIV